MKNVKGYKRLNYKEHLRLNRYYGAIHNAAYFFNKYFVNQNIYYTDNLCLKVKARKSNFMHLCGIKYEKGAASFFTDALNKNIDENSIYIKKMGQLFKSCKFYRNLKS